MNDDNIKKTPTEMEFKTADARIEVKSVSEDGICHIKAYGCCFGNIDSWGDIILPGALDDFLASDQAKRMALCWQHDFHTVIGKITDMGVDDYGMWFEADVLPTSAGKDAAILLKAGAVKEFSIGYRADKYRYEKRDGYDYEIRILEAITIYEVSPVTIAANDKAVLISAKAGDHNDETKQTSNTTFDMTPEEIKAMQESIEKAAAEKAAAEVKTLETKLETANKTITEQKEAIDNLDSSIKEQQEAINELKANKKESIRDFKSAFRAALEEKRSELEAAFAAKKQGFDITLELKTVYDIGTGLVSPNNFVSVAVDPTIHAAVPVANAFIMAFGMRPRTANKLGWIESTAQNGADYVAELAQNTNKSDVSFSEVTRQFAKIAHTMRISTEFSDWFEQLYNYCVNEGVRMINNKIDDEIYNGAGVDVTYPNKVYGLKASGQRTAFSALGTYQDATDADVLFDAAMQIAKEGYNADVAFVTWATYAGLRGLKDANGNYIFDQARSQLGGLRVYPSSRLASGEALVCDTSCVEIYAGNSFELEFVRNGVYDAYDVYFRKAVQVKVATPNKKGVIYIAAIATSRAAINSDGPVAKIAGTVDGTAGAIKTKAVSAS